ncbi:hypothetical protein Tco_0660177 [Tanacetum coccineum]
MIFGFRLPENGTDIAKISRKRSKLDKHGHGNGKECTRAGRMLSKSTLGQPKGSGNGWMRYENGGESLENMVESGGGDGGLKGCLVPWFVKQRSPKTPILSVLDEGDLFV